MARPSDSSARPVFEIVLGFAGAILVVPLLLRTVRGLFRVGIVRRLLADAAVAGVATLLTRDDVLDKLFGGRGSSGEGADEGAGGRAGARGGARRLKAGDEGEGSTRS